MRRARITALTLAGLVLMPSACSAATIKSDSSDINFQGEVEAEISFYEVLSGWSPDDRHSSETIRTAKLGNALQVYAMVVGSAFLALLMPRARRRLQDEMAAEETSRTL